MAHKANGAQTRTAFDATRCPPTPLSGSQKTNRDLFYPVRELPSPLSSSPSLSVLPLLRLASSDFRSVTAPSLVSNIPARLHPPLHANMESLVRKMTNRKESVGLRLPVDPAVHRFSHYLKVITHTMDFDIMLTTLQHGQYKTVKDFVNDIRLIFTNCHAFIPEDHFQSRNAKLLEKILDMEAPKLQRKEQELKSAT